MEIVIKIALFASFVEISSPIESVVEGKGCYVNIAMDFWSFLALDHLNCFERYDQL